MKRYAYNVLLNLDIVALATVCNLTAEQIDDYKLRQNAIVEKKREYGKRSRDKYKNNDDYKKRRCLASKRCAEKHKDEIKAMRRTPEYRTRQANYARKRRAKMTDEQRAEYNAKQRERRRQAKEQAQQCNEKQHINASNAGLTSITS